MSINLTDELHAATTKGKIASAKEVYLDGDKENLQQVGERTHQMEEAIKGIGVSGGASVATAVSYDNKISGMTSVTAQGAIDELATKKANTSDVNSKIQKEQERVNTELDKKFDKENIAQELGDAEDKVISQKAVSTELSNLNNTTNKNVFSANAEINAFIKEIYIENWNGGDLYFGTVNTNDSGLVSIFIRSLEKNDVITIYKQESKDFYFNERDGVKAYVIVDKNVSITYNSRGKKTDSNKVSSKAFSLINSPMIKEKYFTNHKTENTNAANDVTSTELSWKNFIYYKMNNKTNLLTSWKKESLCKIEQFIISLKVSYKYIDDKEKVETYLSHLYMRALHIAEDGFWFNLNNLNPSLSPSFQWILYNTPFCDSKEEGIKSYTVTYGDYTTTVTVNWNYYFKTTNFSAIEPSGNLEITNYLNTSKLNVSVEESIENINKEISNKLDKENIVQELGDAEDKVISQKGITESLKKNNSSIVSIKNILPNLCNNENILTNKSFSEFNISNGRLNIVASGNTDVSIARKTNVNIPIKAKHKYSLAYKVLFKDKVLLHSSDSLSLFFWAKRKNSENVDAYTCSFVQPEDIKPTTQEIIFVRGSFIPEFDGVINTIELRKYNNTKTTEKILDIEISYIMLLDSTDSGLEEYQLREILLQKDCFFEDVQLFKYHPIHQLYYNLKLRSLGDSLPETIAFQYWIANELEMKYSTEFELNTKQVEYNGQNVISYRSTWGSTRVAPVISSSTNERFMANASIYMRAKSLKYDMPDVLIILAGYNDPQAGRPYIDGGTYVQPADYGINDAPYIGDEIDLVSDKTQTAPSFGASYRGMLEQIIKDNPRCRIILCGVPRGKGEANKFDKENDWNEGKNKVIEKIAKEYGYSFVNLADLYGVNKFNYEYLTKDNLHFSNFGGRRVAMEILAKAF